MEKDVPDFNMFPFCFHQIASYMKVLKLDSPILEVGIGNL